MPFKSVINEFYARDASKKVRSVFRTKALNGEHYGSKSPYGYLKSPIDKRKLIIDDEAAAVVRDIFQMAGNGLSPRNIATQLFKSGVLPPAALYYRRTGHIHARYDPDQTCGWSEMTVKRILKNQVYLGHMVNHRQATKSFKTKSKIGIPESGWIIVKDTHPPIIDETAFGKAQKLLSVKRRDNKGRQENIFAGIIFCADCGKRLNYMSGGKHRGGKGGYECGGYRRCPVSGTEKKCTPHHIGFVPIYNAVLRHLQKTVDSMLNTQNLLVTLNDRIHTDTAEALKNREKHKRRAMKLKLLMKSTLEQSAAGVLEGSIVSELLSEYQNEYKAVLSAIEGDEKRRAVQAEDRRQAENALRSAAKLALRAQTVAGPASHSQPVASENRSLAQYEKRQPQTDVTGSAIREYMAEYGKYIPINELSREIVLDFIDKLVVYEPKKTGNMRTYKIDIFYRFNHGVPEPDVPL